MKRQNLYLLAIVAATAAQCMLTAQEKNTSGTAAAQILAQQNSEYALSRQRRARIEQILAEAVKNGTDITRPDAVSAIETQISKEMPLSPAIELRSESVQKLDQEAERLMRKKFDAALEKKLQAAAEKKAVEKYPAIARGTEVTFTYEKGRYAGSTIKGVFLSATARYVQIGDRRIPYVDMESSQRAMFDAQYNQEQRSRYVRELLGNFAAKKKETQQEIFLQLLAGQRLENEKNGYLYDTQKMRWETARQYFQTILKPAQEKAKVEFAAAAARKAAEQAEKQKAQDAVGYSEGLAKIDTSDNARYEEIMKDVTARRQEIYKKFAGVDACQGYGNAVWGVSRSEVAYIFSKEAGATMKSDLAGDTVSFENGTPAAVRFYYRNNKLYKVEELYGTISFEVFEKVKANCHEALGNSTEEKARSGQDLFKMLERGELKPADIRSAEDKDAYDADVYVFHWTGEYSKGILTFVYNREEDVYEGVTLTKENFKENAGK